MFSAALFNKYLIKQFADPVLASSSPPPEVVDTLVGILESRPGDTVYPSNLREHGQHATSAGYFAQEINWGNVSIGKINSVLHGLEAHSPNDCSRGRNSDDGWCDCYQRGMLVSLLVSSSNRKN
jgi:hypothetical protein